jgi:hypothetical protein
MLAILTLLAGAAACGDDTDSARPATSTATAGLAAIAGSYDLAAGDQQRFLLGLIGPDNESVAYGTVDIAFRYTGPAANPLPEPRPGPSATGRFLPLPGYDDDHDHTDEPALVSTGEALGVYATDPVTFDAAGFWDATVTLTIDGDPVAATAAFEVLDTHEVPAVGDPAPRTANPILGDPDVAPEAIDSRATGTDAAPDEVLHRTRIVDALDAGRPLVVVVSTPTFCQSRFCGPVTDAVQQLADAYGDRAAFVHLEVWADFASRRLNPAAAEWIQPRGDSEGREPWVFVIDRTGTIRHRFDNVAGDTELRAAIDDVTTP